MKTIGIIIEANPFHNGHKYFIEQIPRGDNDIIVAILSGSLVQRGELSVLTKHDKAELLVAAGVDIVCNLPAIFANQGGSFFARHAIRHLQQFKFDTLYFGSETADLKQLQNFCYQPESFQKGIHKSLDNLKANDILGISYLKAIEQLELNIAVHVIKRINNDYNDLTVKYPIASATSIRHAFKNNLPFNNSLPPLAYQKLLNLNLACLTPLFINNLCYCYERKLDIFLSEGGELINHLYKCYLTNPHAELTTILKTASNKNNSYYKLSRLAFNIIFLLQVNEYDETITYLHILGLSGKGKKHLKNIDNDLICFNLKQQNNIQATYEKQVNNLLQQCALNTTINDYQKPVII